ncbi:hypothetical protein PQQ96_33755 [Paraburkholderia sediminicola]|uniref:hypothetical protein n=1 Tax=Paraburkholderia sediminicola TaxID=458836 RepID=UPI0038B76DD8
MTYQSNMNALKMYLVAEEAFDPASRYQANVSQAKPRSQNAYTTLLRAPAATLAGSMADRDEIQSVAILGYN